MILHPNWRGILRHAWSARLIIVAALCEFASVVTEAFLGAGYFSKALAIGAGAASAAALVSRLSLQRNYPVKE